MCDRLGLRSVPVRRIVNPAFARCCAGDRPIRRSARRRARHRGRTNGARGTTRDCATPARATNRGDGPRFTENESPPPWPALSVQPPQVVAVCVTESPQLSPEAVENLFSSLLSVFIQPKLVGRFEADRPQRLRLRVSPSFASGSKRRHVSTRELRAGRLSPGPRAKRQDQTAWISRNSTPLARKGPAKVAW